MFSHSNPTPLNRAPHKRNLAQDTMREAYEQHMQRINQEEVDRRLLQHHQQEVRQHELELQQQQQIQQRQQGEREVGGVG